MSLLTAIEAEFTKARADVGAAIEFFTHKAEQALQAEVTALKADEAKLMDDLKQAVADAKATALAQVQQSAPEAAALVSQVVTDVENALVAVLTKHLVP